jgi:hypothetical protein
MIALNAAIGGYGVEYVASAEDDQHGVYGFEYVNTGDPYTPTICYYDGRYSLATWGDLLEILEHTGIHFK